MSNNIKSKIFDDIFKEFKLHSTQLDHKVSVKPLEGAIIRHYHRVNLENHLINPAVISVHHDLNETDDWLMFNRFEDNYRKAAKIFCLNNSQIKFLNEKGINNTVHIPHGYAPEYLQFNIKTPPTYRKFRIGIFSKRYPRKVKGEAYLLELFKRLDTRYFEIILVGEGRIYEASFLRKMGFEVFSHEHLPYPVFCTLYKYIDALLMSSLFEGGPASIPEAIATGTPVYANPVGMAIDLVKNNINGLILSGDPEIDCIRITSYSLESNKFSTLLNGASKQSSKALTWKEVIKLYEQQYRELLDKTFFRNG